MNQASFLPKLRLDHGGSVREGRRKIARPFSHKHAIHVVLRSHRARGDWSLLTRQNERFVKALLDQLARHYRIRVYQYVNVGNHLHLLLKTEVSQHSQAKEDFQNFLRRFSGAIAFHITGAKKTKPQGGFWEKHAYSRHSEWGKQYKGVTEYFTKNFFESKNLWERTKQGGWLTPWLEDLAAAGIPPGVPRSAS